MTKQQARAAFKAWTLAIDAKIECNDKTKSIEDVANQYGRAITNTEDMEEVAECFDWDKVLELLDSVEGQ